MKRKITEGTKTLPDPERRRFLEKADSVMAGSIILPSLSFAAGNPGQKPIKTLANLKDAVSGSVIENGTPNYEPWRRSMIWQYRNFRRYPDIMVQAENENDVVAAVKFARENKMKITTRSGGHSWSGCFMRNGGVLLDLSRLQSVEIDVEGKQAIVEPGVIGRILNARLGEVGLAFPTAHCGMVGVSGFLLGGGLGLNGTAWGVPVQVIYRLLILLLPRVKNCMPVQKKTRIIFGQRVVQVRGCSLQSHVFTSNATPCQRQ